MAENPNTAPEETKGADTTAQVGTETTAPTTTTGAKEEAKKPTASEVKKAQKAAADAEKKADAAVKAAEAAKQDAADKKAEALAAENDLPKPTFTGEDERKYRFSETAPKTMNIDGKTYTQAAIMKNDELMNTLINGNSSFVEPVYS